MKNPEESMRMCALKIIGMQRRVWGGVFFFLVLVWF
jgi:hypothetical protein